jgi:hypothetical protein
MQAYKRVRIEKFSDWRISYVQAYKRDRRNEQNNQPHSQLRWLWNWSRDADDWVLVRSGCDCRACYAHLELIGQLNPERYLTLTNPPYPSDDENDPNYKPKFFRPKRLHASEINRRRIKKTINRFAIY